MGTRSSISIKTEDDTYKGIYCNWDGYLEYNGIVLYEYYGSYEKAMELIKQGDLSSLDSNCKLVEGHNFDNRVPGQCVYYHRDRGEGWENTGPKEYDDYKDLLNFVGQEYDYVFKNGEWYVSYLNENDKLLENLLLNTTYSEKIKEIKKRRKQFDRKQKLERVKNEN